MVDEGAPAHQRTSAPFAFFHFPHQRKKDELYIIYYNIKISRHALMQVYIFRFGALVRWCG